MKKLVLVAIMLLVPFTSFALDMMDDADLDSMTAQSGVTIVISDLEIEQTAATSAWGDQQGVTAPITTAWIVQENRNASEQTINGTIKIDVIADYGSVVGNTAVVFTLENLIIKEDIGKDLTISLATTTGTAAPVTNTSGILGQYYSTTGTQTISGAVAISAH